MRRARLVATKAGIALIVAVALAGASIAYAVTRFTTELPASFVAIEATYALSILDAEGEPLGGLEFGEVVQGNVAFASFAVRNDGNTAASLAFRIRTGDGEGNVYASTARCVLPDRNRPSRDNSLPEDIAQELRHAHQAVHAELGEIDTDEQRERHEQFHRDLEERIRHVLGNQPTQRDVAPIVDRIVGQRIDIPGVAGLCVVVAPRSPERRLLLSPGGAVPVAPSRSPERRLLLPPGGTVPVAVMLSADPDVAVARQDFTILVDAQDQSEPAQLSDPLRDR